KLDQNYSDYTVYNNEYKANKKLNMYFSKNHILACIYNDIEQGKRVFITTNMSKDFIQYIVTIIGFIEKEQGIDIPKLIVTADTNDYMEVKQYIKDLTNKEVVEKQKYQVVIASPTLGTGVSIDGDVFDSVYGIFNNKIYTYQECDQAISRVRSCDNVNVFIQPISSENPKSEEQLYDEIIKSEEITNTLGVFGENGRELNPTEEMYAKFYARVRTFYDNCLIQKPQKFTRLRQSNGDKVNFIKVDDTMSQFGKSLIKLAREKTVDIAINLIKNSEDITDNGAYEYMNGGLQLTTEEKYELKKYKIANFYSVPVSDVTEEQIRAVQEDDVMTKYSNLRLLYSKDDTLVNRDDNERIFSLDIMPHYKHRSRKNELFKLMIEASGLCVEQLMENARKYDEILAIAEKANDYKKGSRQYKAARKEFNDAMSKIKVVVTHEQISAFAECIEEHKVEINQVFGSNIKDPMDKSASVKVFNSLMGEMGIELKVSRKGSQGSTGKEYSMDYSCLSSYAEKFFAEKTDIMNKEVSKPELIELNPVVVEAEVGMFEPKKNKLLSLMNV
ncbi:MAG: hypothetical protein KZQ57_07535, partial [gamma proteobacterium symbiont of Lucinoma myriamae]|nr:hypothetical protein [gamma proteobacterium symbiont of Lucinoma myriamae]